MSYEDLIGTRWQRKGRKFGKNPVPGVYPYNGYTVLMVTNLLHDHPSHPPQVIYKGDNGKKWSLPVHKWPGSLEPETEDNFKKVPVSIDLDQDIITELKKVQNFIKKDDEHCPDYSVTKNVYIRQIQDVIDKYK